MQAATLPSPVAPRVEQLQDADEAGTDIQQSGAGFFRRCVDLLAHRIQLTGCRDDRCLGALADSSCLCRKLSDQLPLLDERKHLRGMFLLTHASPPAGKRTQERLGRHGKTQGVATPYDR
uniref:Uncharacterized protein n=1 Tax=Ralstonia solanacearum TaxID=305 RepID=A0A0S4U0S6_RALSL|nr:conserved protein of unknown function [Ralstonia solanacearum]